MREFEVKRKTDKRVCDEDRVGEEEKWQTCCQNQQKAHRMKQASAEKERVTSAPQSEQLVKTQELPLPKRKGTEPSVQITRLGDEIESTSVRVPPWQESGASKQEQVKSEKSQLYPERQVPRRRGRPNKENLPTRKQGCVTGCKSSPGGSEEYWFYSKSGQK